MVVHPSGTWYGARVQYDQKLVQHGGTISKQIGAFMWYIGKLHSSDAAFQIQWMYYVFNDFRNPKRLLILGTTREIH